MPAEERLSELLIALKEVGRRYGKTPSQVALNWIICRGAVPIPGANRVFMETLLVILILYFVGLVYPRRQKSWIFLDTPHLFLWEYPKIYGNFEYFLDTPHLFLMHSLPFPGGEASQEL